MVQPNHIHGGEQRTDSIDAPPITSLPQHVPVVDRVTPELSLRAEIIRGHASHELRPLLFIQQEQLRVGPNVARVRRNEKGQVTNQAHALSAGMSFQPFALAEQQELSEANLIDVARQIAPGLGYSCRLTLDH